MRINLPIRIASQFGGFAGDESGKGFADQAVDPQAMTVGVIPLLTDAQWLLVGTLPMASALSACTCVCYSLPSGGIDGGRDQETSWH